MACLEKLGDTVGEPPSTFQHHFFCVSISSFFAFKEGMYDTQTSALRGSPTVSGRYSGARIFSQANHCLTKSYSEPQVFVQMPLLVHSGLPRDRGHKGCTGN